MVYCAGLNSTFHQFLRPRRSEAVEATAIMMIAGQTPQTKSIAQVNAVDMTTPWGSWPRPWMRGSSSSTTSRNAVMSNGATSWTLEVVITLATATASSVQPARTHEYQTRLDNVTFRSENSLCLITGSLPPDSRYGSYRPAGHGLER